MRPVADVTDAELAVLKVLWERGPTAIREIAGELYPGGTIAHYATVQKLLERLESKQCVASERTGRANLYQAMVDREGLIAHRLQATADRLCAGSLTPLLTHLVGSAQLSPVELQELRQLVDQLDPQGGRR